LFQSERNAFCTPTDLSIFSDDDEKDVAMLDSRQATSTPPTASQQVPAERWSPYVARHTREPVYVYIVVGRGHRLHWRLTGVRGAVIAPVEMRGRGAYVRGTSGG